MNRFKKFGAVVLIILMNALVLGIFPLNILLIWKNFPQWVMILASVVDIVVVLLLAGKTFSGKAAKIIAVTITCIFTALCVLFAYACPYWNSDGHKSNRPIHYYENSDLTKKEALDDLEEVMDYLRKYHVSFVDGLTPEVQAKYEDVKADFETKDTVKRIEFIRGVRSILHEIKDAHTTFNSWDKMLISDGPEMESKGYSIYSVNGITEDRMKELMEPYYSYETPRKITVDMENLFNLDLCGVEAPFEVVWKNEDGDEESRTYSREDFITDDEYYDLLDKYLPSDNNDYVYYEIDGEKSLAILTLKRCRISEHYREVLREMFTEIKEKNIENLAIDLRGNGGGDTYVVNELFKYLPVDTYYQGDNFRKIRWNFLTFDQSGVTKNKKNAELEFDGKVYVLTDEDTFSSAMLFTEMVVDNGLGKVIGESPAETCNHCGELTQFYFDDIGMWLALSTAYYTRIDQSKGDYIEPDYPCSGEEAIDTLYDIVR
ncbi:S41 family peptidase [Butyrivibrio sp. AE2032]|uniref:S41 family peptidase n=1 Tax=Butyrivibrio sp. AE2032 TaxID=1458463 RepID=UPI00054D0B1F|nr:S41 family peptidase [Butyrivibrio sp. AE2032]